MVYRASAGGGSGGTTEITVGTTPISNGADTRVIFQDGSVVGEDSGLTFNKTTDILTTTGGLTSNGDILLSKGGGQGQYLLFDANSGEYVALISRNNRAINIYQSWVITWNSSGNAYENVDTGLSRKAAGVVGVGTGAAGSVAGYYNWGGQARVTADVSFVSTATLANVTGLSAPVTAGRTYTFNVVLYTTANVAGGIKAAVNATAAATSVIYEGYSMHLNTILGQTRATAVGTAVGGTTTAIAATVFICGTITPSATGTFTVQAAQNVTVATSTVVLAGSYMQVYDTP